MNKALRNIVVLLSLAPVFTGCGVTTNIYTKSSRAAFGRSACILQLESLDKDKDAGIKVREILATELLNENVLANIVDLGVTDDAARKLKIRGTTELGKDTLKAIGEELKVNSIIFGSIPSFGKDAKEREGRVEVSINLTMVDAQSGETLWRGNSSKVAKVTLSEIFGLTAGPTPLEVSREVIRSFVSSLASELESGGDNDFTYRYREPITNRTPRSEEPKSSPPVRSEVQSPGESEEEASPLPTMVPLRRKRR